MTISPAPKPDLEPPESGRAGVSGAAGQAGRLVRVDLDAESIGRSTRDVDHERSVAIYDLIEENSFRPQAADGPAMDGEFCLKLAIAQNKLVFEITRPDASMVATHILSLTPFRRIVKDYFMICDSYYQAIRTQTPTQIETIDMARRGIHNEGSDLLMERLAGKVTVDFDTARRLFTLITVLRWKG